MNKKDSISKLQQTIIDKFYSNKPLKIIWNKNERNYLWNLSKKKDELVNFSFLKNKCPSIYDQINKSRLLKRNIQPAIFSECVYSQSLAELFNLDYFIKFEDIDKNDLSWEIQNCINEYDITPRYIYTNYSQNCFLIQAGGPNFADAILFIDNNPFFIEYKEPGAKTSEVDLPKYDDEGNIIWTEKWLKENPQFNKMAREKTNLNFFEVAGRNINDFSTESIEYAINNNYVSDFIVTEDKNGLLTMLPSKQITNWASKVESEIRPAGRNHYKVWTNKKLIEILESKQAKLLNSIVNILKNNVSERKERGGNQVSGYKLHEFFFVYKKEVKEDENNLVFNINKVRQLKPTITAKIFFNDLEYDRVKSEYRSRDNILSRW
ncbi:Uncharacterised protein [Mycoplasmopsis californica]|uniref:YqaJ viral recombinase domain-containing protein n=1 Tax=Mycoplasmopsis equigenitalium TaxID=114883 RepID=A0ABY5J0L8_9BACT|nr:hypothetical protein [Mycoplasmopsis equigenitalium]UUD36807.1 hypothetical protein NPA09_02820 [Mycoplasmopsis equigenitalium]VEU69895.1 Uncharacterised protein [Mycoplasmopsis californica]